MKKFLIIAALLFSSISFTGCITMDRKSEMIVLQGKSTWSDDNKIIESPEGYFVNTYEWIEIDENTKQLVITLSNNKEYGEK